MVDLRRRSPELSPGPAKIQPGSSPSLDPRSNSPASSAQTPQNSPRTVGDELTEPDPSPSIFIFVFLALFVSLATTLSLVGKATVALGSDLRARGHRAVEVDDVECAADRRKVPPLVAGDQHSAVCDRGYRTISRTAIMPLSSWLRMWQCRTVLPT
jgi:hypothetical protein